MDYAKVVYTPERVGLRLEPAGIGSRFIAMLLDTLFQALAVILILLSFFLLGFNNLIEHQNLMSWYMAVLIIGVFMLISGYFTIFEWLMKGRTPGKAIMKLRVVRANGAPVDFAGSLIRNIFRLADMLPGLYCVGILVMFVSRESRRLGDYVGGTMVIKDRVWKIKSADLDRKAAEAEPIGNEVQRVSPDKGLFPLTPEEYHQVKEYMDRKESFVEPARRKLAETLAERYWEKFAVPSEERRWPEQFLERIYLSNK